MDRALAVSVAVAVLILMSAFLLGPAGEETTTLPRVQSCDELTSLVVPQEYYYPVYPLIYATREGVKGEVKGGAEYSRTNVQVEGIDEPDVVKTDGTSIFFARWSEILGVTAYPPEDLNLRFTIPSRSRGIFVQDRYLVSFEEEGYRNPFSPWKTYVKIYNKETGEEIRKIRIYGQYIDARLFNGKVYVVVERRFRRYEPVVIYDGVKRRTLCHPYYIPELAPFDAMISVVEIEPGSGVKRTVSFLAGSRSIVYMSERNVYIAFRKNVSPRKVVEMLVDRLKKYVDQVPEGPPEEQLDYILEEMEEKGMEDEFAEVWDEVMAEVERIGESTHLVRIALDSMEVESKGRVPGEVLNQFSMDEYRDYFRLATHTDEGNNVYILDKDLKIVGRLEGLEKGERIYAVRFWGNRGYVVTFRQVDPLLVVDLSDPSNPRLLGALKIPGYSTYLHPWGVYLLGIGMEVQENRTSGLKISLFDVSDPEEPVEVSKYFLPSSYSEALHNHRAILVSKERNLLAFPVCSMGACGYYFFRVTPEIELLGHVDCSGPRRGLYIDGYYYVVCNGEILALDGEFKEVKRLELQEMGGKVPLPREVK